jgi:hypothetical protein
MMKKTLIALVTLAFASMPSFAVTKLEAKKPPKIYCCAVDNW